MPGAISLLSTVPSHVGVAYRDIGVAVGDRGYAMAIAHVVVADDEFLNRDLLAEICARLKIACRTVKDGVQALKALEEQEADLLITDVRMPGMGGMRLLHKAREKWPELPVVMMTAFASVESAVEAMREGASDYLLKPFGVEQVEALLLRLSERQKLVRQVRVLSEEIRDRHQERRMLGDSLAMRQVATVIERAARAGATVLVNGESGTGKELVARALHEGSPRATGPFIKVNCAALTETLLASELFGHEKGAFTGADIMRQGRFELADGGTLLLDEISEISPELQAKLLRVLEEREFERVGGSKPIKTDVRIIATTNRDLPAEVAAGRFREDLYYRLNVIPIRLPPLRERPGDLPGLIAHYLQRFGAQLGGAPTLSADALVLLAAYPWPGNVRELVNALERLTVLAGDATLDAAALRLHLPELGRSAAAPAPAVKTNSNEGGIGADLSLAELEQRHIQTVLDRHAGDRRAAAQVLGITPRALASRLGAEALARAG